MELSVIGLLDYCLNNIIEEITEKSSKIMNKKVNIIWYNEYTIEKNVLSR